MRGAGDFRIVLTGRPVDKRRMHTLLTKSRFKVGSSCPRKLFYAKQNTIYPDALQDDDFMAALAENGHQVGTLAQLLHPGGTLVETLNHDDAVAQTAQLLQQPSVTIYEAALRVGSYLVRVDILEKTPGRIRLLEVKATSWTDDPDTKPFRGKRGGILSDWLPYLEDVAFQTWVARRALEVDVDPYLVLIDTSFVVRGDGLFRQLRVEHDADGRVRIAVRDPAVAVALGRGALRTVSARTEVDALIAGTAGIDAETGPDGGNLVERAERYARLLTSGTPVPMPPPIGPACKTCQFCVGPTPAKPHVRSGREQCWQEALPGVYRPDRTPVYALWRFTGASVQNLFDAGQHFLDQITADDLKKPNQRQLRQLDGMARPDAPPVIDPAIPEAMSSWTYPIHVLDFETIAPALPFFRGMRPYETVPFQFSCHHIQADGTITHDDFLLADAGVFPTWHFLLALRQSLGDTGTILRYAAHENSVLRQVRRQLLEQVAGHRELPDLPAGLDTADLVAWLDSITTQTKEEGGVAGRRSMVDLCALVKDHYYHARMGGSNSIKKVLPAAMCASPWLRQRYSQPVGYGTHLRDQVFWQPSADPQVPLDPYHLLAPVFADIVLPPDMDDEEELNNGGAAMVAFARIHYCDMPADQQAALRQALLRYCELDTLAMIMVVEHWRRG
jgi:hypothetical protein